MNLNLDKQHIDRLGEIFDKYGMDAQAELILNNELEYIVEYFDEIIGNSNIVLLMSVCNISEQLFIEYCLGEYSEIDNLDF